MIFPCASFHGLAARLKTTKPYPFALQIGAMDGVQFDLLNQHLIQQGWQGLLVEPVPDMFAMLQDTYKNQPHIKLANCAISDYDGTLMLRRISPEAVSRGLIPTKSLGMTTSVSSQSILNDPELIKKFPGLEAQHIQEISVPCITLQNLLNNKQITHIDLVVIDTEGADWMIAQQLDLESYHPELICIEHTSLSNDDKASCLRHFIIHGYSAYLCLEDMENFLFSKTPA